METSQEPALRFPEFSGAWGDKRLGDFFTFKNGVNADKSMYGSGRKFINVMDVISAAPIYHDNIIGAVEISDRDFLKNEVVFGDLLFQRSSETREEVGQSNIYLDAVSATFGGFVIRGRAKGKLEPRYFNALLKTSAVRKDMTSRSGGSTRYNIGQESLEAVAVRVAPCLLEQRKLADFFEAIDARIELLKRRLSALDAYKKGMMQRIFSRDLRFKKADGSQFPDWQERRLGEIFSERGARSNPEGTLLSVTLRDGVKRLSDLDRVDNSSTDKSNYKAVRAGDIAYNSMRMWQGASGLSAYDGIVSPAYTVIRCKTGQKPMFWAHYFKLSELVHKFQRFSQGLTSDTWNLKFPALSTIRTNVPIEEEQEKIVNFLSAIDDKIGAVTKQLDAMERFKKGLLQQMFV